MDYKKLLEPIEEGNPTGFYLKGERAQYRALRNTFNAAQSSFRRLIETPESSSDEALFEENQNNWQEVSQACWQTLTEKSKDVEVYCWWVMSLVFQDQSIARIAAALETLPPFIETFWPDINPYLPDEKLKSSEPAEQASERAELQLRPLVQLLGESEGSGLLYMPLQMLSLVGDIDHSQYLSATKTQTLPALTEKAKQTFPLLKEEITQTVESLALAIDSVNTLDAWLKKTLAEFSLPVISTHFLLANLQDCLKAIEFLVKDSFAQWPLDEPVQAPEAASPKQEQIATETNETQAEQIQPQAQVVVSSGAEFNASIQVQNRDQAFQELRKIADYFAKSEPHSPVSFLLEKAIRWGYMSLPELMQEMVSGNDQVLKHIKTITGMNDDKAVLPNSTNTALISDMLSKSNTISAPKDEDQNASTESNSVGTVQQAADTSETIESDSSTEFEW